LSVWLDWLRVAPAALVNYIRENQKRVSKTNQPISELHEARLILLPEIP
jgi:hypothetical protein